ncbi:MAG TPA: hypothetical protein VKT72_13840 [Candidatus Baltobacteraceae bacterium]|nr:hypothetical protein [Candidatus Baltobacteraceae bacterium]
MLAAFVVVGVYWNRENLAIRIKSVFVPVPPKAAQTPPPSKRVESAFVANVGWAFSALPECFTQTERVNGPPKYVLARVPQGATMLRPGAVIDAADCHVAVTSDTVVITRGTDRLSVPPIARLYNVPGGSIALLRVANGGYELRVYQTK